MIFDPSSIGTLEKLLRFVTKIKTQSVFRIGFIALLVLSIGVLTGYIPSPILKMAEQHVMIIQDNQHITETQTQLIEIAKLQLYLAREICLHGAETSNDRARCDRQSIKDVIISSLEEAPYLPPVTLSKQ